MVVIKFGGEKRAYAINDVDGWKNCMHSLMQNRREYTVEYFDL